MRGRDIGRLPAVVNPRRRAEAEVHFRLFLESYFPIAFSLPWDNDQLNVIDQMHLAGFVDGVRKRNLYRGRGKTSLCIGLALWALLCGRRQCVVAFSARDSEAIELLNSVKLELQANDALYEDFPEVCYPIRCLEGIAIRCHRQTCQGAPTGMRWEERGITLPSSSTLDVRGILSNFTGLNRRGIRPDLAIADDVETDASQRSPVQTAKRQAAISQIQQLGGAGQSIATVIVSSPKIADS